jgi:iron-sulfur cluster assembly protein
MIAMDNAIHVTDKARERVKSLMNESGYDENYFLRVGVVGGGCSGLSYKMDFDKELKPADQVFEDNGIKVVTDLKSFLYLVNTTLDFSDGLNGKGFHFNNPNASRTCSCGESFAV